MNYTINNITNKTTLNENSDESITALIYGIIILLCCCFGILKFPKFDGSIEYIQKNNVSQIMYHRLSVWSKCFTTTTLGACVGI